ncbi:MAG: septum formation initiator family protein [Firmicutes bacterium]|nr:septum formation initiator family protein [Bacillota bacterium]
MTGRRKKERFNFLACVFVVAILLVFGFALYVQADTYFAVKQQLEQSVKEQRRAVAKNIDLVHDIEYQDSDAYIEKIAREHLGMVRPNEIVFVDENK